MEDPIAANRELWYAWADAHVDSEFYDTEGFLAGRETLDPVELEGAGDVRGKSLLHLQCHFGQSTLSWARHGASVVGVDFSPRAIAIARELAEKLELNARFIESDVYDTLAHLDGERFDIVFTGAGLRITSLREYPYLAFKWFVRVLSGEVLLLTRKVGGRWIRRSTFRS